MEKCDNTVCLQAKDVCTGPVEFFLSITFSRSWQFSSMKNEVTPIPFNKHLKIAYI